MAIFDRFRSVDKARARTGPTIPSDAGMVTQTNPTVTGNVAAINSETVAGSKTLRNHVRTNPFLNAAVVLRKAQVASADWSILVKSPDIRMTAALAATQQQIITLLESPNVTGRNTSFAGLLEPVVDDILTLGLGAIMPERDLSGRVIGLHYLDASRVRFVPGWKSDKNGARYILMNDDGRTGKLLMNNELITIVLNATTYNETGYSPVQVLRDQLNAFYDAFRSAWVTQKKRSPAGILNLENMPEPELLKLQRLFEAELEGNSVIAFMNHPIEDLKYVQLGDVKLKEQGADWFMDFIIKSICAVFQVSPIMIQWTEGTNRACYSDDTETLTENGWKYYWQVQPGERIATYNPYSGCIEYHAPKGLYVYPYEGDMLHFRSQNTDILVTPDHDMWVRVEQKTYRKRKQPNKPYEKIKAEALENRPRFTFMAAGRYHGDRQETFTLPGVVRTAASDIPDRDIDMDLWLEFLGYVISEGCVFSNANYSGKYLVNLSQKKAHNIPTIQACLDRLPFNSCVHTSKDGTTRWQINDKALWIWLSENVGQKSYTKRLPALARSLDEEQLAILFNALMLGDGCYDTRSNRKSFYYSTTSEQLANDVQHLAILLGFRAILHLHHKKRKDHHHDAFRVVMCSDPEVGLKPSNISRESYNGDVYCFEVPNHLFVTRRNGFVAIQGNTAKESVKIAGDQGIVPLMQMIAGFINREVLSTFVGGEKLQFVWNELLTKDTAQNADTLRKRAGTLPQWVTRNELRRADGLDPLHTDPNDKLYPFYNEINVWVGTGQEVPVSIAITLPQYQSMAVQQAAKVQQAEANRGSDEPPVSGVDNTEDDQLEEDEDEGGAASRTEEGNSN